MKTTTNEAEVYIVELFNAPVQRVFEAWTDPKKLMQWYAPEGCSIQFKKLEITVGGQFHSCIIHPQFGECWCIGVYKEIMPNNKIVFTMQNADEKGNPVNPASIGMDPDWPGEMLVSILLTDENGKTKMELRQTVSQELARKTGAYSGWIQMFTKLKECF